jgi:hypothetical protein
MNIKSTLGNLCTPAKLYLALSVIALIFVAINSFSFITIIIKLIFIALWTFLLNWICSKGYTTISWILVLLPYVLFILMFLVTLEIANKTAKHHISQSQQNVEQTKDSTMVQPSMMAQASPSTMVPSSGMVNPSTMNTGMNYSVTTV